METNIQIYTNIPKTNGLIPGACTLRVTWPSGDKYTQIYTNGLISRACTRRVTWPSGALETSTTSPGTICPESTLLLWSSMLKSERGLSDFLAGALGWLATSGGIVG